MRLTVVILLCLAAIQLAHGRAINSDKELTETLREVLRYYKTRNAQDTENRAVGGKKKESIDVQKLDPESDDEDEVESQRVEVPGKEIKPKNMQDKNKEEQKEDNNDRAPPAKNTRSYTKGAFKRVFEKTASYWSDGKIPYTIDASTYAGSESELSLLKDLLANSIKQIEENSCVKWIERTNEENYVKFINDKGCYSYVGKIGGAQPISIQAYGCTTVHTVLHEMLHAMGGQHEQSRSDRAGKTSINWDKIDSSALNNFAAENTMNAQPYDYKSLLQYELSSFGKSGNSMAIPDSSFEYLITNTKKKLSLYDIGEINNAYKCTADCTNKCQNGGVVIKGYGNCGCKCPSGLKGDDCSQLDTSDGCGGFITLTSGEQKTISMDSYKGGLLCTWVVKGPVDTRIKATIESMDLPYNTEDDCYHWIEFRDYLIGDRGKERCGTQGGSSFTKVMNGDPSRMMVRFNSAKYKDETPGKGFSVQVESLESACSKSPCQSGTACTDKTDGGYQCTCTNGLSGEKCNTVKASATTICDFQTDFKGCVFQLDKKNSQFDLTLASTGNQNYPGAGNENGYQFLTMANYKSSMQYRKAYLVTSASFEESERCLSFKYLYTNQFYNDYEDAKFIFQYEGSDGEKKTLYTVGTTDVKIGSWQTVSSTIPATNGLKITIEAVEGYQNLALDDIALKPGACA